MKKILLAAVCSMVVSGAVFAGESAVSDLKANTDLSIERVSFETPNPADSKAGFAAKSRIDCVIMVNGGKNTVSFAVAKLGTRKAELLSLGETENDGPVLTGENNTDIGTMNGEGGDMHVSKETIELIGDNDGCNFVRIVLYKNSGYTSGWASESGTEVAPWYTKDVACTVKEMKSTKSGAIQPNCWSLNRYLCTSTPGCAWSGTVMAGQCVPSYHP
jgi:hypothetical protein